MEHCHLQLTSISNPANNIDNTHVDNKPAAAIQNQPPSIHELTPAPESPKTAGATITWTTDATDPDGDHISYEYFLNGNSVTGWTRDNAWTWQTSEKDIGNNIIEVLVRDMNHASQSGSDDRKSASFTISPHPTGPVYLSDLGTSKVAKNDTSKGPMYYTPPGAAFDSVNDVTGQSWDDMKAIVGYYTDKNDKAKLGWSTETINGLVGRCLEDRYKTDNNMRFDSWEISVVKPEDAMENVFRDALHAIKLQNKNYLRMLTEPCAHEMPSETTSTGEQSNVTGGKGELVLDHLDAIATKYWNEGEGGTYIISNKTNVDRGDRNFEAANDSSWDIGHFNMKLTADIDLPGQGPNK